MGCAISKGFERERYCATRLYIAVCLLFICLIVIIMSCVMGDCVVTPLLFFDVALLFTPHQSMKRRQQSHRVSHPGTSIPSFTPAQSSHRSPRHFIASIISAQSSFSHPSTAIALAIPAHSSHQSHWHSPRSVTSVQPAHQSPRHCHRINHPGKLSHQSPRHSQRINNPGTVIVQSPQHSHRISHPGTVIVSVAMRIQSRYQNQPFYKFKCISLFCPKSCLSLQMGLERLSYLCSELLF